MRKLEAVDKASHRRGRTNDTPVTKKPKFKPTKQENGEKHLESSRTAIHNPLLTLTEKVPTWYKLAQSSERDATIAAEKSSSGQSNSRQLVDKYRSMADALYRNEVQAFGRSNGDTSDDRWVESTIRKGTLKDRIAAMSVVVSTSPIHKFHALDGLLSMAGCCASGVQPTNSRVSQMAAQTLEDLFLNTFLPPDRKLVTLADRPLYKYEQEGSKIAGKKAAKKNLSPKILLLWRFEELVKDKYQMFLRQYMSHVFKEGMDVQKIATIRSAGTLLRSAPEQEALLLQMLVNKMGDPDRKVAAASGHELRKVLQFHPVMQAIVAREVQQLLHRPQLSSRALYNCITFLNQLQLDRHDQDLPVALIRTYFRLFEVAMKQKSASDKDADENPMRGRLLSALLTGVNRAHPYLPSSDKELESHMDALYKVVHTAPPAAATQSFLLLFHMAIGIPDDARKSAVKSPDSPVETARQDRFYRALYSSLSDTALLGTGKHLTMFFNLLYKAMKYDHCTTRVVAFAKRIMCTTIHCGSNVTAASLFLLNEICKAHPALLSCFNEVLEYPDSMRVLDATKREPRAALMVAQSDSAIRSDDLLAPAWELMLCLQHFHPSVKKFASSMGSIAYAGDPLADFGLAPFLDKFAYRNPKTSEKVAAPAKQATRVGERRNGLKSLADSQSVLPVNDPSFVRKDCVREDDEFFHHFFVEQSRRDEIKGVTRHKPSEDKSSTDLEERALDVAEEKDVDHSKFDDLESQWETDSEEEAFVDSLVEKIIEDSVEVDGFGPADLDDEDPDTDGWDNLHDEGSDIDDDAGHLVRSAGHDGTSSSDDDDDENVMDRGMDTDESVEFPIKLNKNEDIESLSSTSSEFDSTLIDNDDEALFDETSSSEDLVVGTEDRPATNGEASVFAAIEDYEERINKSWRTMKRPADELIETTGHRRRRKRN